MWRNCTDREVEIIKAIQENPMISQQELAQNLGIARSSVAAHITNLMKKGVILGKGYVINHDTYVCVVGGANMDIQGKADEKLAEGTSNPGKIEMSIGGVGRNIAHNLALLGVSTQLITALGKDFYGQKLLSQTERAGVKLDYSLILEEENTGVYLALLDDDGDMRVALSHMDIFKKLNVSTLMEKRHILERAEILVVDTNIPRESIEYMIDISKRNGIPLFLDTVSIAKAEKVKDLIGYFHTIKPNLSEVEFLTGRSITTLEDMKEAAESLLQKGVKEVVISQGKAGAFYHDGKDYGQVTPYNIEIKNTTGAGDSFVAGLIYGTIEGVDLKEKVKIAMACGALTSSSENTVYEQLNINKVMNLIKGGR